MNQYEKGLPTFGHIVYITNIRIRTRLTFNTRIHCYLLTLSFISWHIYTVLWNPNSCLQSHISVSITKMAMVSSALFTLKFKEQMLLLKPLAHDLLRWQNSTRPAVSAYCYSTILFTGFLFKPPSSAHSFILFTDHGFVLQYIAS